MEKEIDHLKKHLKETENKQQTLLKTYQEREQKLRNDLKEVKSQKENALTRLGLWLISTTVLSLLHLSLNTVFITIYIMPDCV